MKINGWVVVALLVAVVAVEEVRMQGLRKDLASTPPPVASRSEETAGSSMGAAEEGAEAMPPKLARRVETPDEPETEVSDMGKTLRKMTENPVTRSMMAQSVKAMAAMWYADLVESFGLNKEEADYFLDLKSNLLADQQQIGMKLMGAKDDEERHALLAEMEESKKQTEEAVKSFLNNDEDFAAYQDFEKKLPEQQQLGGLRTAMTDAGAPLDPGQETALIDAMYEARTSYKGTDWNGAEGMEALADANVKDRFEQDWNAQSEIINRKVGDVLNEEQMAAFQSYRDQVKEMQLMGLEMASKMFQKPEK
ncbi:hypothetical protein [Haloferula sargassicola]|uniref:Uncharacterized protein n=1 Tax=Haloferula sargassicola TaxID=490096 RepID=A0ABP9UNJ1_9BACT